MVWVFQVFFYVNYVVIESCFGFCMGYVNGLFKIFVMVYYMYIMIIIIIWCFDNDWIIDLFGKGFVFGSVVI